MSRQLDIETERRTEARTKALVKALEYGLNGALESQGIELLGFSFKYDAWNCLMTIRADLGGERSISFVGSDTVINCILKAYSGARNSTLQWRADKYHKKST